MARISEYLGKIFTEGIPEHGIPEEYMTYEHLIWEGGSKSCLITCENEPKKGGFYNDAGGGYVISAEAVNIRDNGIHTGFIDLGIAIGDAMLDSTININIAPEHADAILAAIKVGILHAVFIAKKQK